MKRKTTYTIRISAAEGILYEAIMSYLEKEMGAMNNFSITTKLHSGGNSYAPVGQMIIWKYGWPVLIQCVRDTIPAATSHFNAYKLEMIISGFLAEKRILKLLKDAEEHYIDKMKNKNDQVAIYKMDRKGSTEFVCFSKPKNLSQIVLQNGKIEELDRTITKWSGQEQQYRRLGLTHKLGMLLHGTPGTGKTSLAYSIAHRLGYGVVRCDIQGLLRSGFVSSKMVYVIDDVDRILNSVVMDEEKESMTQLPLNEVLELLDARIAANNIVIVLTCNNVYALDPAIYRPGRIDWTCEFVPPTREMAERFMSLFYNKRISLPQFKEGSSMSFYQVCCLRHMNDPEGAVREAMDANSNINLSVGTREAKQLEAA